MSMLQRDSICRSLPASERVSEEQRMHSRGHIWTMHDWKRRGRKPHPCRLPTPLATPTCSSDSWSLSENSATRREQEVRSALATPTRRPAWVHGDSRTAMTTLDWRTSAPANTTSSSCCRLPGDACRHTTWCGCGIIVSVDFAALSPGG